LVPLEDADQDKVKDVPVTALVVRPVGADGAVVTVVCEPPAACAAPVPTDVVMSAWIDAGESAWL
jgi:hypothetical protein